MLNVESLSKSFHLALTDDIYIEALNNLSFKVGKGEFLAIVGPSGVGKSSVLKCIYRTYLPTGGRILYLSKLYGLIDLASSSERRILNLRAGELGYASQFLKVIPRVAAIDVVAERLIPLGYGMEEARSKTAILLKELQIPAELWQAYPVTFSGGEQQRINLARSLITRPRLLLLDEPTASLDGKTKSLVIDMLLSLKKKGTTMIGIFHDMEAMEKLADEVLDMTKAKAGIQPKLAGGELS